MYKLYNSRERVERVIRHREVGYIPRGEICIDDGVISKEIQREKVGFDEKHDFIKKLGHDIVCLSPEFQGNGHGLPDLKDVTLKDLKQWVDKTKLFTFAVIDGVIGWGVRLFGFQEFITLPYRSPLSFSNFINEVEKINTMLADNFIEEGVDGIVFADDLAYTKALIFRPTTLREHIMPSLAFQVEKVLSKDSVAFFHSDGNITQILDDIQDMGFHGLHCIDKNSSMDIEDLVLKYGDTLCFWGTLDVKDLDRSAEDEHLNKIVKDVIELSHKSAFILGTTCGIFDGINISGLKRIYDKLTSMVLYES